MKIYRQEIIMLEVKVLTVKLIIYFFMTNNYDEIEERLIKYYKPKYNSVVKQNKNKSNNIYNSKNNLIDHIERSMGSEQSKK